MYCRFGRISIFLIETSEYTRWKYNNPIQRYWFEFLWNRRYLSDSILKILSGIAFVFPSDGWWHIEESHSNKSEKLFNLYWHELWNQEKCSSLVPPRSIFYVKLAWLISIFTSKKVWKFLMKIQLTISDPKRKRR